MYSSGKNNAVDVEKGKSQDHAPTEECRVACERLTAEYTIIQDKIDKAADFRYRVRSWSVTITTGLLAASTTVKFPWWYSFIGLVPVGLFAINEHNQKCLGDALGDRAIEIEEALEVVDSKLGIGTPELFGVGPRIGRQLRMVAKNGRQMPFRIRKMHSASRLKAAKISPGRLGRLKEWWDYKWNWVSWKSDFLFYIGQVIIIAIVGSINGFRDHFSLSVPERTSTAIVTNYVFNATNDQLGVPILMSNSFAPNLTITNTVFTSNEFKIVNSVLVTNTKILTNASPQNTTNDDEH